MSVVQRGRTAMPDRPAPPRDPETRRSGGRRGVEAGVGRGLRGRTAATAVHGRRLRGLHRRHGGGAASATAPGCAGRRNGCGERSSERSSERKSAARRMTDGCGTRPLPRYGLAAAFGQGGCREIVTRGQAPRQHRTEVTWVTRMGGGSATGTTGAAAAARAVAAGTAGVLRAYGARKLRHRQELGRPGSRSRSWHREPGPERRGPRSGSRSVRGVVRAPCSVLRGRCPVRAGGAGRSR
jgi:hypothetical protein